jgi:hypothetical protein
MGSNMALMMPVQHLRLLLLPTERQITPTAGHFN